MNRQFVEGDDGFGDRARKRRLDLFAELYERFAHHLTFIAPPASWSGFIRPSHAGLGPIPVVSGAYPSKDGRATPDQ